MKRSLALLLLALCCHWLVLPVTSSSADPDRQERTDITITADDQFDAAHGVRSGSGTSRDPYVISGWQLRNIFIRDTASHLVIKDNTITGKLTLNWNGDGLTVVDNEVGDLRVNQNVKRTGDATSGLIADNQFGVVGQLRHFDGVFENNVVGNPGSMRIPFFETRAVLFDGFNGGQFRNNTLYGYLDVKLHGHHHGSTYGESSHNHAHHGKDEGAEASHDDMDHTDRWHEVFVTGNTIHSPGPWALRYYDHAHAGDDRTAASEENPELNKPHVHHTRVFIHDNKLVGSGLMVDVFNADDSRHLGTKRGSVSLVGNQIALVRETSDEFSWNDGINVQRAVDLDLTIARNTITNSVEGPGAGALASDSGIFLYDLDKARVFIRDNSVADVAFGVRASQFTESVHWWVTELATSGVDEDVYYDNSVANPPNEG